MEKPFRRLIVLSLFVASAALATDLPPAPDGFSWQQLDAIRGALLMPNGWHFLVRTNHGETNYYLSEDDLSGRDLEGELGTALLAGVVHVDKSDAQDRALKMLLMLEKSEGAELQDTWKTEVGGLEGFGARVRMTVNDHPPLMMAALAIGNPKTGALYLFVYESPETRWKQTWESGRKMFDSVRLDDGY